MKSLIKQDEAYSSFVCVCVFCAFFACCCFCAFYKAFCAIALDAFAVLATGLLTVLGVGLGGGLSLDLYGVIFEFCFLLLIN